MTSEIMKIVSTTKDLSLDTSMFTVSFQMVKESIPFVYTSDVDRGFRKFKNITVQ